MANYFVAYDMNAINKKRQDDIDAHLQKLRRLGIYRVLATVWYVHYRGTADQLGEYVDRILAEDERLLVIDANDCRMRNLMVPSPVIQNCWVAGSLDA